MTAGRRVAGITVIVAVTAAAAADVDGRSIERSGEELEGGKEGRGRPDAAHQRREKAGKGFPLRANRCRRRRCNFLQYRKNSSLPLPLRSYIVHCLTVC